MRYLHRIFEEDLPRYQGANSNLISWFLNSIGCLDGSNEVDFEGLMSHILKCMGLFLKLRRRSEGYQLSTAEAKVFLGSVIDMCAQGMKTVERTSFEMARLPAGVDLATTVFNYSTNDNTEEPSAATNAAASVAVMPTEVSASVWQPLYWAVISPHVSAANELQALIRLKKLSDETVLTSSLPLTKETLLHFASKAKDDNTEALRLLSLQAPRAAFTQDVDGNLPLHAAAQYTESVDNLHCLLQLNPKAIHSQNNRGRTPIHVLAARMTRLQFPLLECLLNAAKPDDLMIQDKDGNTPLHLAWYEWSMKDAIVARRIFDANPKAALVTNSKAELSLHCITSECFKEGPSTIDEAESLVGAMVAYFNSNCGNPESDEYPLLVADREGNTPLHNACGARHQSVIWMLVPTILRACPRAAAVLNVFIQLFPLHDYIDHIPYNCDPQNQPALIETVRMLLDACPLAASIHREFDDDTYPLHVVARSGPLEVVRMIYDAYPDAVREVSTGLFTYADGGIDGLDGTPLLFAAWNRSSIDGPKIIRFLYEKFPEAALLLPDNPRSVHTPMHYVVLSSIESIKTLCELEPAALKVQTPLGRTPLHFFIRSVTGINLSSGVSGWKNCKLISENVAKLLLLAKSCPEAAVIKDGYNGTPHQALKSGGASACIQRALLRAAPEADMPAFHEMNYQARRGALYLLYSAVPREANDMLLWLKLRERADATLIQHVVSYL